MSDYIVFAASNGKNLELSKKIDDILKAEDVTSEVIDLTQVELPLYHPRAEKIGIPEKAVELTQKMVKARGFIFCAPEYNGSIPPTLNNLIAWVSRASKDWREAFNSKPAVIATHSGSGGLHALIAMRMQLSYIGMNVLGRQIHTHYNKEFNEESAKSILEQLIKN